MNKTVVKHETKRRGVALRDREQVRAIREQDKRLELKR